MVETVGTLEDEIRALLMKEEKSEKISGNFKISMKEDGRIEITELPAINLEQLELPLTSHQENPKKEDRKNETAKLN
jgi:hypothetical protein